MKYEEIVQQVKDNFTSADVSDYKKHLAIQFNITGEGEGAFYVELNNGVVDVQPYEYYDRDVIFTMSAVDLFSLIDGELDTTKAYLSGQIGVSNVTLALELKKLLDDLKVKKVKTSTVDTKTITKTTTTKPKQETQKIVKTKPETQPVATQKTQTVSSKVNSKVNTEVAKEVAPVKNSVPSKKAPARNRTKKPTTK